MRREGRGSITDQNNCFFLQLQWRFPRASCDFVGFLFAFYGVILLIFVIMILRIASNGCKTTVCVVLYFISVISLIYFSYCCGFVEQIKKCWSTYLDINRKVIIENREDSATSLSSLVEVTSQLVCSVRSHFG